MDIAIDGGTTNTCAALVRDSNVLTTAKRAVGVRDRTNGGTDPLVTAAAECVREVMQAGGVDWPQIEHVVACGMLTSGIGLCEIPHVAVPAGDEEIAKCVVTRLFSEIAPKPIHFVPGVRTENDMMRGEESETLGILSLTGRHGPAWLLLPGSHTKLVSVDGRNRIDGIHTSMAGEVLAALAGHTVLRASLPDGLPNDPDLEIVREGASRAADYGLLSAAFQTRIQQVLGNRSPEHCGAFLTGAVVGTDLLELQRAGFFGDEVPIWIGGPEPLRTVYADLAHFLLGKTPANIEAVEESICKVATAIGSLTIVRSITPALDVETSVTQ